MPLVFAKLAVAGHTLPWPGQLGRTFNPEGELIDPDDPYFSLALRDGSLIEGDPPANENTDPQPDVGPVVADAAA